jgi:hypothetical protein
MISTCPNCALASVDEWRVEELSILDNAKKLVITTRDFWKGVASWMESLDQRFRHALAFLIGAVITAAALRHGVHIYGGSSAKKFARGR